MRKIAFFLVSALLLCTSCTKIKQAFHYGTATAEAMEEDYNQKGQKFINVDFCSPDSMVVLSTVFPAVGDLRSAGSTPLTDSIIAYIGNCFEGFAGAYKQTHDPQKAIERAGNAKHRSFTKEISDMKSELEGDIPEYMFAWEYENSVEIEYDLERYVTIINKTYEYQGGVHGMSTFYGTSFDKATGRVIDKSIFKHTGSASFMALFKKELLDYFLSEDDTEEESDLSMFLLIEPENLSVDDSNMRLTDHSIIFLYQPYEIAAYAYGFPSVELSFQQLKPYLTAEGLRLIGDVR